MHKIIENNFIIILSLVLTILILGRIFAGVAKRFGLPEITGELVAGILLGPTVLGNFSPDIFAMIFSHSKDVSTFMQYFLQLSLVLIMFATGLEIDFGSVVKHKRPAFLITGCGVAMPFCAGLLIALYMPEWFPTPLNNYSEFTFPLFLGTAFAIEALPVIAKILVDSQMLNTSAGVIILSSAIVTDIIGWSIFAFITKADESPTVLSLLCIGLLFIITIRSGMKLFKLFFKKIENSSHWQCQIISCCIAICLIFTICSTALSLHFCLGAFMAGIISREALREYSQIKDTISDFIMGLFAPLYFVSIGMKVNFIEHFNFKLVALIIILASASKIISVFIGSYVSGIRGRKAMLISVALNARGAMEIVFSSIALSLGIISDSVYIALVIMALLTSMSSGIFVKKFANRRVI